MTISDVITTSKKFLKDDTGFSNVTFTSIEGIEADSKWKLVATVEEPTPRKRELVVDDRDGKIVSYKLL